MPAPTSVPTTSPTYFGNNPTPLPTSSPTNPTFLPTFQPSIPHCSIPYEQYNVLKILYNVTNGINWDVSCKWDFSSNSSSEACNWYGITCNSNCEVSEINLLSCNLQGLLQGLIPSIENLTSLTYLDLGSNSLFGTIPSQLCNLKSLEYLSLRHNMISGTLPTELASLSNLTTLRLNVNSISGTIPSSLGALTNLYLLNLRENGLSGTIPIELTNLHQLIYLYLYNNKLQGPILFNSNNSPLLRIIEVHNNNLQGQIPLFSSAIEIINLSNNFFSGTIPAAQFSNPYLIYVDLSSNSLSGTIPTLVTQQLTFLSLANNKITGSISCDLGFVTALTTLDLSSNSITGTIPSEIGNILGMKVLMLSNNRLTGTIPSQLGALMLQSLILDSNQLTGGIPVTFQSLSSIKYLYLQNNKLTGTIPSALFMQPFLEGINLSNNFVSNTLENLFTSGTSRTLQYIILSHMHLTGSIPEALFELPNLVTLVLTGNCLTGALPLSLCNSNISNVYLDGIGVGSGCNKDDDDKSQFHGTIPSCVFSLSSLSVLHLMGNGLTGTLSDLPANSNLTVLNLANNQLSGTIPTSIQKHTLFNTVDMSSNKLSGTLSDLFHPPTILLNITKNRLSGKPPTLLLNSFANLTLNVLEGNLLGCPALENDVNKAKVTCGSTAVDISFASAAITFIFVMILLLLAWRKQDTFILIHIKRELLKWWKDYYRYLSLPSNASHKEILSLYHTRNALNILEQACSTSLVILAFYLFVILMTYLGMKTIAGKDYAMYEFQYLFASTASFFHGEGAAACIWIYLTISSTIIALFLTTSRPLGLMAAKSGLQDATRVKSDDELAGVDYIDYTKKVITQVLAEILVMVVVFVINLGYLYIVFFIQPPFIDLINFIYAFIKFIVINNFIPSVTKLIRKNSRAIHFVIMIMMVNVVVPGLAVLIESPLCYYDKFYRPKVFVSYDYPETQYSLDAEGTGIVKLVYKTAIDTITPRWFYSYLCSSSFLNSYLTNFVFYYSINSIVPLFNFISMLIPARFLDKAVKGQEKNIFNIIDDTEVDSPSVELTNINIQQSSKQQSDVEKIDQSTKQQTDVEQSDQSVRIENNGTTENDDDNKTSRDNEYLIDVSNLMPNLCVDVIIFLTFGLASPLLAILITLRIFINTILWRIALGRYVSIVSKKFSLNACYEKLEYAFNDEWRCLAKSWWVMTIFVACFWSVFIFDIVGDKKPQNSFIALSLTIILYPLLFIVLQILLSGDVINDNDRTAIERATFNITTSSISINRVRAQVASLSMGLHRWIWAHILRKKTIFDSSDDYEDINTLCRDSILKETVSPFYQHRNE